MFELEFHIPYIAVRRGPVVVDRRSFGGQPLRKAIALPLPRTKLEETDHYYEVQLSFLVTGVDDWLWTSYGLVDTYHGSEPQRLAYLNDGNPTEPATGGSKSLDFPMWCPREFFLTGLNRRLMQAVREFRAGMDAFDGRMSAYVSDVLRIWLNVWADHVRRAQELCSTSSMTQTKQGRRN